MTSTVDLVRVRASLARLDVLAEGHPRERAAALENELLEALMAEEDGPGAIPVKLPRELLDRADALIPALRADPELAPLLGRVSRTAVVRVALMRGLAELERAAKRRGAL